jgi:hypothetical protein
MAGIAKDDRMRTPTARKWIIYWDGGPKLASGRRDKAVVVAPEVKPTWVY